MQESDHLKKLDNPDLKRGVKRLQTSQVMAILQIKMLPTLFFDKGIGVVSG